MIFGSRNESEGSGLTMESKARRKAVGDGRKLLQSKRLSRRKHESFRQNGDPRINPRMPGAGAPGRAASGGVPLDSSAFAPLSRTIANLSRGRFLEA